jgi:allophanate hydrolase
VLADPVVTNSRLGTYTNFVNLLDLCGIAVPTGRQQNGLPMSVTLLAAAGRDALLGAIGRELHAKTSMSMGATGHAVPPAEPILSTRSATEDIELAVVGAHLSGMPLNTQLTSIGAKFCRTARTSASYRLHALAGQEVAKPGLIRMAPEAGTEIEVEIWRLPAAAFGQFIASIQPPLGIGTIELVDGARCKGFLVEAAGLAGAVDISEYGGWRNYVSRETIALRKAAT